MNRATKEDYDNADKKSILFGALLSLLLAPITFQLTRFLESDPFKSDVLASLLTIALSIVLIVSFNNLLKRSDSPSNRNKNELRSHSRSNFFRLFSSTSSTSPSKIPKEKDQTNCQQRKKIDPKYFKPKYIIHELMTFWGTTYTVITWGSFYVIGGTIVATERLARKIKTKCSKDQHQQSFNSSRCTGRNDSFTGSFMSSSNKSTNSESSEDKDTIKRITTWTKRSFASVKRRFSKFVNTSAPQWTSMAALNGSNSAEAREAAAVGRN